MGFTTGFLGGLTLTYSVLYLTIYLHKANRNVQHTLLAQSHTLLNSIYEPLPPSPDPPAYELRKAGLVEVLKDRWNAEVEKMVRNVQETDWDEERDKMERRIMNVWANLRHTETGQEVEKRLKESSQEASQAVKDALGNAKEAVGGAKEEVKEQTRGKRLLEQ